VVDRQNFQPEVLLIAETIGLPLESFDLVINASQRAGRDRGVEPGQDAAAVADQCRDNTVPRRMTLVPLPSGRFRRLPS